MLRAPLAPVIIGTTYFNNVLFPAVNGQLYRPVAQTFGNVILNNSTSLGYAQAENLGKVLIVGNATLIGASATSPTGNEMFYAERGGLIRVASTATLTGPAQGSTNNSLFYDEFGGGHID